VTAQAPSIAADRAAGIPVGRSVYGMTEADIKNTLVKIAQYIREGARTPSIRKIADSAVTRQYPRGIRTTNRQVAQALLDYVREHVRYRPDPNMVEMTQSAKITLCADDAPICIPVGDCDDLVSAYGALLGSMGVDVRVLVQDYGPGNDEQHVLILFQDDDGSWLTADPSSKTKPIGLKDPAVSEYTVDPLNPQDIRMPNAPQAEFITVGRPREGKVIGKPCCKACGEGKPCTGCGGKVHPCACETGQMVGAPWRHFSAGPRLLGATSLDPSGRYTQALVDINAMALGIQAGDAKAGLGSATAPATPDYQGAIQAYQQAGNLGANAIGPEIDAAGAPNITQPFTQPAWQTNVALAGIQTSSSSTQGDASSARDLVNAMLSYYQQAVQAGGASLTASASGGSPPGNKSALTAIGLLSLAGGLGYVAWRAHSRGRHG
jgi:hypothetical protein